MSVDTITLGGIALSSSRSTWRGCIQSSCSAAACLTMSTLKSSVSSVQSSSSASQSALPAAMSAARCARVASQASSRPARRRARAAAAAPAAPADAHVDALHETEHLGVGVHLDDLGPGRPVVEAVLGQRAERAEPGAQRQHHVGPRDEAHGRLGALVAQRPAPQRMRRRERVVVQVAVHHRAAQPLGQSHRLGHGVAHHHAPARHHHRERGSGQQLGGLVEGAVAAGAPVESLGLAGCQRRCRRRSGRGGC